MYFSFEEKSGGIIHYVSIRKQIDPITKYFMQIVSFQVTFLAFRILLMSTVKAVLQCAAFFSATCLAPPTQVAEELHVVTCYLCNLSRDICFVFARATLHEVELSSTFCNDCSNFQSPLHSVTTPPATCLARFARSANQNPYYPLLSPPQSQVCELLPVPLHSVTPCLCNCNAALLNVVRQVERKIV